MATLHPFRMKNLSTRRPVFFKPVQSTVLWIVRTTLHRRNRRGNKVKNHHTARSGISVWQWTAAGRCFNISGKNHKGNTIAAIRWKT